MKLNIIGPVSNLSYGYVTQNIVKSLLKLGHSVNLQSIGPIEPDEVYAPFIDKCGKELDDSPTLIIWHHFDLKRYARPNALNIGFPIFEVNEFSKEEMEQLNSMDMVLATCKWYERILKKVMTKPTAIVSLGYDPDVFFPASNTDSDFVRFINIGKWEIRKGHQELIKAFGAEFKGVLDVSLTLACDNPFIQEDNAKWALYASKYIAPNQLNILPLRFNSCVDVAKLIAQHDIGVFPSHAEGWNMPLLECIAMNKLTIATNYSAHTEYCNLMNCDLLDITDEEPCFDGQFFHGQGTWAKLGEPQINQLRKLMRTQYENVKQRVVNQKKEKSRFTWDNTVQEMMYIIGQLYGQKTQSSSSTTQQNQEGTVYNRCVSG
jgi:glycosyltransferase involved in cell wall biosynthesis